MSAANSPTGLYVALEPAEDNIAAATFA